MTKYGYARVSSKSQEDNSSLKGQKEELIKNGILEENILVEVGSAANEIKNRPVFQTLINQKLQEGDVLMVTRIDRCSRNTLEFLKLQDILFKRKIEFISLDLPHSDDPGINRLIATTLSSIAEFENNRRKDRQKKGIRAAQKEGKYQGRKTIIDKTLIQKVKHLKETKNLSVTDITKVTGVSTPTIYKVLKEHLGYVSNRLVKREEPNPGK
jgi:DNA invertase Pin-like site-specific DNA recombinase